MKEMRRLISFILSLAVVSGCFVTPTFANSDFAEETAAESVYYQEAEIVSEDIYAAEEMTADAASYADVDIYAEPAAEITAEADMSITENTAEDMTASADAGIPEIIYTENTEADTAEAIQESFVVTAENTEDHRQELETEYAKIRISTPGTDAETIYTLKKAELNDDHLRAFEVEDQMILEAYFFEPSPENKEDNRVELILKDIEKAYIYIIDHSGEIIKYVGEIYRSENGSFETAEDGSGIEKKAEFDLAKIVDRFGCIRQPGGFAIAKAKEAVEEQQTTESNVFFTEIQIVESKETVTEQQTIESADGTVAVTGELPADTNVTVNAAGTDSDEALLAYDISLTDSNGEKIQAQEDWGFVTVSVTDDSFMGIADDEEKDINIYQQTEEDTWEAISNYTLEDNTLTFSAPASSVYAITETILTKTIDSSDGNTYSIKATYEASAGIPMTGTELSVSEMDVLDEVYVQYLNETAEALGVSAGELGYLRMFDISIVGEDGTEYQPDDRVRITVELMDRSESSDMRVVHFGEETEELAAATEGDTVTFTTESFSIFSFADLTTVENVVDAEFGSEYINKAYENDYIVISGCMPRTAIVEANPVEVMIDGMDVLVAYDIKIYAGPVTKELGIAWQPTDGALTVHLKSDALEGREDVSVYHFADGSSVPDKVADTSVSGNSVEFQAESFSVYSLGSAYLRSYRFLTYNENMEYVEYQIYTDNGTTTFTQTIKDAEEELLIPQLPAIPGNTTSTFAGWYEGTGVSYDESTGICTYTSLSETAFDFENIPAVTATETVYLFARFADFAYVIFHDQYNGAINEGEGGFPVAVTRRGEKTGEPATATIQISDVSVSYDNDSDENTAPSMAFYGWSYTKITTPGSNVDDNGDPISRISTESIDITTATHLYPIFISIKWLNYYSGSAGSGATYIPSKYYYDGEGPDSLSVPVRRGYTFQGWYTGSVEIEKDDEGNIISETVTYGTKVSDENGTLVSSMNDEEAGVSVSNGTLFLSKNATLYARWTPVSVKYTVLYWQQNANDDNYYLADFETLYGTAGSQTNAAADKTYDHFHISADQDKTTDGDQADIVQKVINGNGSTAVNVYYDRDVFTLRLVVGAHQVYTNYYFVKTTSTDLGNWGVDAWEDYLRTSNYYHRFTQTTNPFTSTEYTIKSYQKTVNGTKYEFYYIEITDKYEASLNNTWPTVGLGGFDNYKFNSWQVQFQSKYYLDGKAAGLDRRSIKGLYPSMSETIITLNGQVRTSDQGATNTLVACYATSNYDYVYNYYFWDPDTETYPADNDPDISRPSQATTTWTAATVSVFDGYEHQSGLMKHTGGNNSGYGGTVYFYYKPVQHTLTFMYNGNQLGQDTYYYTESLSDADKYRDIAEAAAPEGYYFAGWYENSNGAGDQFDFSGAKMPDADKILYPKYETIWYLIQIDPNYGTMNNGTTGSTWFWEPYNGDPIEEYTWVTRDYVESATGTYYFVKHDREYYGYSDEWSDEEDYNTVRNTYYTTDPGEATELTTFKYAENAYRYAGWYEVDPETGAETLYNFGEPVTHDVYLKLHWKKIGTYFVHYNPVVMQDGATVAGTLDDGDNNEVLFMELDDDNYSDNGDVVVTRIACAPAGYNFVGWRIRGDSSETIYNPGDTFKFLSKYSVTINNQETIILDAVYTRVKTAKIIYNANGGTVTGEGLDYGSLTDTTDTAPTTGFDAEAGTATIENLVNNSEIRLSSGAGFTLEGEGWTAELAGWNTEPDATGTHYELNTNYYVDTEDPMTLYAEWKVNVYFHRNKADSAWGDVANWNGYEAYSEDVYYTTVYAGQTVTAPADIPVSTADDNLMFHYWGTIRYSEDIPAVYEFSTPVTGELHLYAYWAGPIELPVHVLDSSNEIIDQVDTWRRVEKIDVQTGNIIRFTQNGIAADYVNVPGGYEYAFTAVHRSTDSIQNITEADAVRQVYYNAAERVLYVRYADAGKPDMPLADEDEVYFVYYKTEILPIGYELVSSDGSLTQKHEVTSTDSLGQYSMSDGITAPLTLAGYSDNGATYYAYALGTEGAGNVSGMQVITSTTNSQNSRPDLQVRNTWRGFEYSLDGSVWTRCGYDALQLYVLYFDSQPTIITLNEETIGTAEDMRKRFGYTVTVTETVTNYKRTDRYTRSWRNGNYTYTLVERGEGEQIGEPVDYELTQLPVVSLANGDQQAYTIFYIKNADEITRPYYSSGRNYYQDYSYTVTTQTINIVQNDYTSDSFATEITEVSDGTADQPYTWSYTTTESSVDQSVTYANTHTPLMVEVHVALAGADGITLDDEDRAENYSFTIAINDPADEANVRTFLNEIPADELFTGSSDYGFAGIVYGSGEMEQGSIVTVAGSGIRNVTYGKISGNEYELFFDGNTSRQMGDYNVYYVYYPLPKLVYVKENAGGMLTRIQGSTDGSTVTDTLTYNGAVQMLNGVTVAQEQLLPVGTDMFTVSQSGGFGMLPYLDDGTEKLYLSYSKLGVAGTSDASNTSDLAAVSTDKLLYLQVIGNQVKWSINNNIWYAFNGSAPTVYAIYKEKGYDLRITKTVEGDKDDYSKEFTLTISSMLITDTSYTVSNYLGYPTVAATPSNGSVPGTIELTVKHGSDITIQGLPKGEYTITESNAGGAVMSAKIGDEEQTVIDNSMTIADLHENTKVDITNKMTQIAPTGWNFDCRPFVLMLGVGAALALIFLSGRRRRME